jgi:hypothetical protein
MAPLLGVMGSVNAQLKAIDKGLEHQAKTHEVAKRLCTAAGVGPVTAISFVPIVDRVERFDNAKQVRAYLGLVSRELSSGEKQLTQLLNCAGTFAHSSSSIGPCSGATRSGPRCSGRATSARSPGDRPPSGRSAFGGQPSRDRRSLHQGDSGAARAQIGQEHTSVRPPRAACPAPTGGRSRALRATSRQRQVNERKPLGSANAATT